MVLQANKGEHEVPPPAPVTMSNALMHLQGPADVLAILREMRDLTRQEVDLLRSIDREQIRNHGHD